MAAYLSAVMADEVMDALGYSGNPIKELGLLPVLISLFIWQNLLKGGSGRILYHNDAARYSYVKAYASTDVGRKIMRSFVHLGLGMQVKSWFSRVPTSSNLADDPSRMKSNLLEVTGAFRVEISWSEIGNLFGIKCQAQNNGG